MHPHEPVLAQYHIFAARRLHFGKLFWINIAFFLALLLLAAAIFKDVGRPALGWCIVVAGLATLQIGYITHRIRMVEDTYERLMNTIEERLRAAGHADCLVAPLSKKYGARSLVTAALAAVGAVLTVAGLVNIVAG